MNIRFSSSMPVCFDVVQSDRLKHIFFCCLTFLSLGVNAQIDIMAMEEEKPSLSVMHRDGYYALISSSDSVYFDHLDTVIVDNRHNSELFYVQKGSKWGLISKTADVYIPIEFDRIEEKYTYYYVVSKDGKNGVYTSRMNVVPCEQDSVIFTHSSGVEFFCKKDNFWGIYNYNGEVIAPNIYDRISIYKFIVELRKGTRNYYLIDNHIVNLDSVEVRKSFKRQAIFRVDEDFYMVKKDDGWGIMNLKLKFVVEPVYQDIRYVMHCNSYLLKRNGKWGMSDFDSKQIIPIVYDSVFFYGGLLVVKNDGLMNFFNLKSKEIVLEPVFDKISYVDNHYYKIGLRGRQTLIDLNTNLVLPFKYEDIYPQEDSCFAYVENGQYGVLDSNGNVLIPANYDDVYIRKKIAFTRRNLAYGIVGLDNKTVLLPNYTAIEPMDEYIEVSDYISGIKFKLNYKLECIENCDDFEKRKK